MFGPEKLAGRIRPQVLGGTRDVDGVWRDQCDEHMLVNRQLIFPVVVLVESRAERVGNWELMLALRADEVGEAIGVSLRKQEAQSRDAAYSD